MLGLNYPTPLNVLMPARQANAIANHLDIRTAEELLEYYPRSYLHYGSNNEIADALPGDTISFIGTVTSTRVIHSTREIYKVDVSDGFTTVSVSFFGSKYAQRALTRGVKAMFTGKLKFYNNQPQLQHPSFVIMQRPDGQGVKSRQSLAAKSGSTGSLRQLAHFGDPEEMLAGKEWLPKYSEKSSLTTWTIYGAVHTVLESMPTLLEPFGQTPEGFIPFDRAVREVHEPGPEGPNRAIERLKYNEALGLALYMALRRLDDLTKVATAYPRIDDRHQARLLTALPFELTRGQLEVLDEISEDMDSDTPMSRLLQGEVGSGKTIVALAGMLQAVDNGAQAALLAPTEVLVQQHARSLRGILDAAGIDVNVVALTGSLPTAQKQKALLDIMTNEAHIVVGTHALIQEGVEFFDLGMIVVDEQHRFGVEQRERLREKGSFSTPHLLVMTATPIPRTVAITVFGDLAISTLTELPGGRKPIESHVMPEFRKTWVERGWEKIREEVALGHQAYVVCPRIEGEGGVLEIGQLLREEIFPELSVEVLHGKMRPEDKDAVMKDFAAGGIDVLVATTVIEVGVDVPNATVMLVREAESFGISQLHQLRGRIGRGGNQSLCLFHTTAEEGSAGLERVVGVAEISNGFELADLDLRLRHEGDVLGTSQSGAKRRLKLINLAHDRDIVERAYADAALLVELDPDRARVVSADISYEDIEYLDKS